MTKRDNQEEENIIEQEESSAPEIYKGLVKECYYISKHTHTSYSDTLNMTPTERRYWIDFINEDFKRNEEELRKIRDKNQQQ